METKECIRTRRSVRAFTEQPVTKEELEEVIGLAAYAPSWKNTQTARYIAISSPEIKKAIADECVMGFSFNQNTIHGAPLLVAVTTVNARSGYERDGSFSTSKGTHWQSFDAGIAAQTFCLAAHEIGLGTVIMGIYDEEKVIETLHVPEEQSVSALIAVGHYDQEPQAPKRKSVDELLSCIE